MGTLGENPIRFMKLDVISEINNLKFCKLLELLKSKSAVEIIFNQTKYRIFTMKNIRLIKTFSDSSVPFNRSEHMKLLHQQGRYVGTSKIGIWNASKEKRKRMKSILAKNALDKTSHGYGSEWHMRMNNRTLLHNKFQGERGYLYLVKFPASIKVGFSKNWERRISYELPHTNHILGGKVIMIISGPTDILADVEFDVFQKFQNYTQLSPDKTRYTEFMNKTVSKDVYEFLQEQVKYNKKLEILIDNKINL